MSRDHQIFIGGNDAHADSAVSCADRVLVGVVSLRVDRNPEMRQPGANFRAYCGGMLADAAGEDEHVQSGERGCQRPIVFLI